MRNASADARIKQTPELLDLGAFHEWNAPVQARQFLSYRLTARD
ncbi:MAG: hypothetical protein RL145_387 [Pseudomonadota bacterium]|jgi:hypothetical protein